MVKYIDYQSLSAIQAQHAVDNKVYLKLARKNIEFHCQNYASILEEM